MKKVSEVLCMAVLLALAMAQAVFADVVATPKDALGGPVFAVAGLIFIGLIILVVWGISFFILKWIKNKNAGQ